MEQIKGTYQYIPETAAVNFSPGQSHYTIPEGYWVGAKYQVSVNGNTLSEDGRTCEPYSKDMVGAAITAIWEDKSSFDWWGANGIDNYEFPLVQRSDYYGNVDQVTLYPQVVTGIEQTGPWWFNPHLPTAMKITYTAANPAHKLYLKFGCNDINNYGWNSYSGPIESGIEFSLASLWINNDNFILDHVYNIDILAANGDPFDSYVSSEKSQFTISAIEVLMPQELFGWVDITDLPGQSGTPSEGWTIQGQAGTWDSVGKQWLSAIGPDIQAECVWLRTNGGLYLNGYCPSKVRIWYTMADQSSTDIPALAFPGVWRANDVLNYCYSGQEIQIDTSIYDIDWNGLQQYLMAIEFVLYGDPGAIPFTIHKIEVYQKIPNMTDFYRNSGGTNQAPENIDYLMPGYTFTKDIEGGGIYNLQQENEYLNRGAGDSTMTSPKGTLWAFDGGFNGNPSGADFNIGNKENLIFAPWAEACGYGPQNMIGWKAICHLVDPDLYFECRFGWWEQNGGGYQMDRPVFAQ